MRNKILKITGLILAIPLVALIILLSYSTITDYKPEPGSTEIIPIQGEGLLSAVPDTFRVMIWNIGYCGLGAEMDFFHDGGKMVRPDETKSAAYLKAVTLYLASMRDSIDFFLLQEVDRMSKRSYHIDQMAAIANELQGFYGAFAVNYAVKFVPVPFRIPYEPYGATYGGLVTFSRYRPLISQRVQYPGGFSWPTSLYMLDRCALEQRYKLGGKRELVLVNTHNTAYDETGVIKQEEMKLIRERYGKEAAQGKLVLLGGDWNQVPPDYQANGKMALPEGYTAQGLENKALPDRFRAVFDTVHTNRALTTPYKAGETFTTLIDYYIASPDLKVIDVQTVDMQFRWSDHQPVILTLSSR